MGEVEVDDVVVGGVGDVMLVVWGLWGGWVLVGEGVEWVVEIEFEGD